VTRTAVVLFTRDLRVHDNPALAAACANADRVVPLFVLDPVLSELSPQSREAVEVLATFVTDAVAASVRPVRGHAAASYAALA